MTETIIGYYDSVEQTEPAFDPGIDVPCLYCGNTLSMEDVRTISMMPFGNSDKSYFYRVHKSCASGASEQAKLEIDALVWNLIEQNGN